MKRRRMFPRHHHGTLPPSGSELTPQHVLIDLFDSDDFPAMVPDPQKAAEIVIQRLVDAGFQIKPANPA